MSIKKQLDRFQPPKVTIVILNWNGLDDTIACLESLKKNDYGNYEVVVIDNGSDNSEALVIEKKYPKVNVIRNKTNKGFTGGCNQGIARSISNSSDYTLLLNNDTIVTKNFLSTMVEFYETKKDAGFVSPKILYPDKKRIWFIGAKVFLGIIRHTNKGRLISEVRVTTEPFYTDYVPGTCLLVKNDVIKSIGPLDDRYFAYYEDLDWTYKVQAKGLKTYVIPSATIYHKKSGSTSEGGHIKFSKIPSYYIARNGIMIATNLSGFKKIVYVSAHLFIKLPLSLLLLVQPNAWKSYLKGVIDGMVMLSKKTVNV